MVRHPEQSEVVALGCSAREDDLFWLRSQQLRYPTTGLIYSE